MAKLNFRSAIKAIFTGIKTYSTSIWKEIGVYRSTFSSFGGNVYANDVARACIRSLAEHSSKANVKAIRRVNGEILKGDQKLQDMITYRPNQFMNGKDFLYKIRTILEITNTAFIYIMRNEIGNCVGLYPMPNGTYEAVDVGGNLYIKFSYPNGIVMAHSWEDLAVLRKDYNSSDIFGDSNDAILTSLELLNTTNQGMANAIKSTSNLRGILKSTKAMLSDEDVKKAKDRFVADYTAMENESGIASIDSTQEFMPITMTPAIANYKSVEELRLNIYRYFGVNEEVIMSKAVGDAWDAFYEARIEGFLIALGLELTYKIYNSRQRGFGNEVIFESNRLQYATTDSKLSLVTQMFDRGFITHNQGLDIFNMAPVEGGDKRYIRKEYSEVDNLDSDVMESTNTAPNVKEVEDDDKQG
jgi:HK97 family phage portal protein